MVVHEEIQPQIEASHIRKQSAVMDSQKYIIVQNHVRELPAVATNETSPAESDENYSNQKGKKRKHSSKITQKQQLSSITVHETEENCPENVQEISKTDLDELRSVYLQCKAIVNKIETKYGHLLDVGATNSKKHKNNPTDEECHCKLNKKIVFDDSGNQTTVVEPTGHHICTRRASEQFLTENTLPQGSLQIEFGDFSYISLPEDMKSLNMLLKDPEIDDNYRYEVIIRMQSLKMDNMNYLRYNRPELVQQLKANCDEVLDFKGTNLSSLSGYIYK